MIDNRHNDSENQCKGCRASVRVKDEVIARALETLVAQGSVLVEDEVYQRRLAQCEACSEFIYGTTCRICGCLLPVRARLADQRCPMPATPRWQ